MTKQQKFAQRLYKILKNYAAVGRRLGVSRQRAEQLINPEKLKARQHTNYLIKTGKIIRQNCFCGQPGEVHHKDYKNPLNIEWLCSFHHKKIHYN